MMRDDGPLLLLLVFILATLFMARGFKWMFPEE